jgi:dUTP pyrophosphatase
METVKFIKLNDKAIEPDYLLPGDAGLDLYAIEECIFYPGTRKLIGTGIAIELPPGFEAQVRPRSSMAHLYGITVLNSPGTIDSEYRGEIKVLLVNLSDCMQKIDRGQRIAQMVVSPVVKVQFELVESLSTTERGEGGFGSTGR